MHIYHDDGHGGDTDDAAADADDDDKWREDNGETWWVGGTWSTINWL